MTLNTSRYDYRIVLSNLGALFSLLCLTCSIVNAAPFDINLLINPGFENNLNGWTTDNATIRTVDPSPHSGISFLFGGNGGRSTSYTYQIVDLMTQGFLPAEIDSGNVNVHYGGWQSGWHTQRDSGKIEIIALDAGKVEISRHDLGWFYSNNTWTLKQGVQLIQANTRYIRFGFYAQRFAGSNNDGYLDDAYLKVTAPPVTTNYGGNSSSNQTQTGSFGEPVNTATGNYYYQHTDLGLPGRGLSLSFTRTLNVQDGNSGPFGMGWTHSYNLILKMQSDNSVVIRMGDGHEEFYDPTGDGNYYQSRYAGIFSTLLKNADGSFTLTQKNQTQIDFTA